MKTITKILFLFYKYYDKGSTKEIAYESSIIALIMIIFINIFSLILLTGVVTYLPFSGNARWLKYIIAFIFYVFPSYILIRKRFKKEDILRTEMKSSSIKKGYFLIVSYILISVITLIFLIKIQS